ncbi:hypothetical protein SEA_YARA_105 [Streptomyces phage Yara]|nr:hypothetical protein SEA_YARA_105 [Streptomyces phage Yara]
MAMKTANEDVYSRIKSASSLIASGVRLGKPEMEAKGRQDFAAAHVENAILVHSQHLTDEARAKLARLLFEASTEPDPTPDLAEVRSVTDPSDIVTDEDISVPVDPQGEYEEEEEDYVDPEDDEDEDL